MKIIKTCGCIDDGITIDGKDISNFNRRKLRDIAVKMIDELYPANGEDFLESIISDILEHVGEYKYLYTCDQCGDSVYEYGIDIIDLD